MKYNLFDPYNIEMLLNELNQYFVSEIDLEQVISKPILNETLSDLFLEIGRVMNGNSSVKNLNSNEIIDDFYETLPSIKQQINKDIEATYDGDPAAKSKQEIQQFYPGVQALKGYRVAHFFEKKEVPMLPRAISEYIHSKTGIDIHPGATIGEYCCIDHGTGIVIGETTVIGNHVKIYQGVTLGALSVPDRTIKDKRHPTVEDHVIIYAKSTILGGNTIIGHHSIVGGNLFITKSIEPHSKVFYTQNSA